MKKCLFVLPLLSVAMLTGCGNNNNAVSGKLTDRDVLLIGDDVYAQHYLSIKNADSHEGSYSSYAPYEIYYKNGDFVVTYNLTTNMSKVTVKGIGTFTYHNVTWRLAKDIQQN